jgi:hypothetical protein
VQVRLRYDADLETYVYAVRLEYQAGQDVPNRGYKCEYLNFYPTGVTDPRCVGCLPDEPAAQGRPFWQAHIYEDIWERGRIVRSPFSRLYLSTQSNIRLREGGLIGCFHHPIGNPCVRLLGDTALRSTLFLCNQLWDLHFRLSEHASSRPLPKGYRMSAEYELLALDEERSRPYLERAVTLPLPEQELADRDFPRFPYVRFPASDSFEEGLRHHETELSSFWTPFARDPDVRLPPGLHWEPVRAQDQAELVWEKGYGRTGSRCLRVTTREAVAAGWQLASHNMVTLETARPYRFSAHVRTEGLRGKGATVACALARDDALFGLKGTGQPTRLTFAGTWLVGTQPWTRVSVELPAAPALAAQGIRGHTARLVLWHEGVGTTWFDDVAVEPV